MVAEDTRKLYIKGAQIITEQYLLNPKANIGNFIETLAKTGTKITDEDQKEIQSLHTKINSINPQEQKNEIDNYWKNVAEHTYHIELSQNDLDQILTPPKITTKQTEKKIEKESEKTAKQDNEVEKTKKNPFLEILDKTGAVLNEGGRRLGMSIGNFFKDNEPDAVEDAEDDPKGNKQKRSSLKTKRYYYVWWLFESKEEFETLRKKHSYPRNRGKDKPYYRELPVKTINDALAGNIDATKDKSNVQGYFLGALGLTARNTKFTDTVNFPEGLDTSKLALLNNKEGPLIALGVAQAKRSIIRSILTKKLRFDVQRLNWKWHVWTGKGKGKKPVTVLVVDQTVFDDHKQSGTLPDLFKKGSPNFEGAEIFLKKNGKKAGSKNADNEGKATITCEFNDEIELTAKYSGYKAGKPHYPGPNPLTVNQALDYVIIPMEKTSVKEPEFLVNPTADEKEKHDKPLQGPFDIAKKPDFGSAKSNNMQLVFNAKAKHTKAKEDVYVQVIIQEINIQEINNNKTLAGTVTIKKGLRKKYNTEINNPCKIEGSISTSGINITSTFDIPENTSGDYRIYCLLRKTNKPITPEEWGFISNDGTYLSLSPEKRTLWDYNYITFSVDPNKEPELTNEGEKKTTKNTKEEVKKVKTEVKNIIKEFVNEAEDLQGTENRLTQNIITNHSDVFNTNSETLDKLLGSIKWKEKSTDHHLETISKLLKKIRDDLGIKGEKQPINIIITILDEKVKYDNNKKNKLAEKISELIEGEKIEGENIETFTLGHLFVNINHMISQLNLEEDEK